MPKHPGADVRLPGRELTRRQAVLALSRPVLARLGIGPWLTASATASAAAQSAANFPGAQLAWPWPPQRSPQGFLVSEKWDGVRALWDGQVLRFRSGRDLVAPAWFLAALPGVPLDGELWTGRGQFDRVSACVRKGVPDEEAWRSVKFMVFDAPGHRAAFAQRAGFIQATLQAAQVPWLLPVAQHPVADVLALQARLQETVRQGGEGLVLHRADALWEPGRTDALYKFKPEPDADGQVIGHQPGKGRLLGLTGALLVRTETGQRLALGSGLSDAQRRDPPPVGAWVTYRYRDRTPSGLPRFASFLRVRAPE